MYCTHTGVTYGNRLEKCTCFSTTDLTHNYVFRPLPQSGFQEVEKFDISCSLAARTSTKAGSCDGLGPVGMHEIHLGCILDGDNFILRRDESTQSVKGGGLS